MSGVSPISYKIHLEPNLDEFNFSGRVEIQARAEKPVDEIQLDMSELAVWGCKVGLKGDFQDCPFSVDVQKEELRISLPERMVGEIHLRIDYMGHINNQMAGFYRSKYSVEGKEEYIAVTQFEESDARRAFPCFDHPAKKATFEVEIVTDETLEAISNGSIAEEKMLGNGNKLVRFLPTPKMSTYLLFFGVGAFEFIHDSNDTLVRVATIPGMAQYARFGLEFGRRSLRFCEEVFGIEYPLPKLDLIAIPDFAFGAMENWGAITFRENLLLHYPNITSKAGEERICEVIAHEIVHQWFGNLVSPSDWKYLWLNESFATYFGHSVVSHYYPEWEVWYEFLQSQTDLALDRDALHETFPIEIPGGEHVVINASTAPIIYNKGGSILRQIEGYLEEKRFREGLRHYLSTHQYGCAASHHLWDALEAVSEEPVKEIMKSWIEQPGFPIIEVERKNDQLTLTQKRFTYLPNESKQEWLVPLSVRFFYADGASKTIKKLLEGKHATLDVGEDVVAYKVNDGQTGFYRVEYRDKSDLHTLGERILNEALEVEDRWGIQNDLYALVKQGDATIDDYLDFLGHYENEHDFLPIISIAGNLHHAYLVLGDHRRDKVASVGKAFLEEVLSRIGHVPDPKEKHATSNLRDQILWHAVLYGSKDVEGFAMGQFSALLKGDPIHPDIMKSVMQIGAFKDHRSSFEWLDARLQSTDSEHERMNILTALGRFSERQAIEKALQYVLEKVPNRNKFVPIGSMAGNPYAIPSLWGWFESNLQELERLHPVHYERVIAAIVPVCGLGMEKRVHAFFEDYMKQKEMAKDVIKMSLERLEINSRMRGLN